MKKLQHGQPEGPVSVRMSAELQKQLDDCAVKIGLKTTDLMRLCMRIGIEHFRRIDYDTAKCIVEAVAKNVTQHPQENPSENSPDLVKSRAWTPTRKTVPTVVSTSPSPVTPPPPASANIVPLPVQHVVALNETPQSPPVSEDRVETTYPKPSRKRKA